MNGKDAMYAPEFDDSIDDIRLSRVNGIPIDPSTPEAFQKGIKKVVDQIIHDNYNTSYDSPSGKIVAIGTRCWHVLEVLRDRMWHPTSNFSNPRTGTDGTRRIRELRAMGFKIEQRRSTAMRPDGKKSAQHEYLWRR